MNRRGENLPPPWIRRGNWQALPSLCPFRAAIFRLSSTSWISWDLLRLGCFLKHCIVPQGETPEFPCTLGTPLKASQGNFEATKSFLWDEKAAGNQNENTTVEECERRRRRWKRLKALVAQSRHGWSSKAIKTELASTWHNRETEMTGWISGLCVPNWGFS